MALGMSLKQRRHASPSPPTRVQLEKQILADAKRDDRRAAVLNRFARAVRVQIAVNRLAGFGAPGAGSPREEACKKGELRHTQTLMAARKLLDTDGEALVRDHARVEEERHEAAAGLALARAEQRRQAEKIKKLEREKKELQRLKQLSEFQLEMEQDRSRTAELENHHLREQLRTAEDGVAQKIKEEGLKAQREFDAHRNALRCDLEDLEAHRDYLLEQNRHLLKLTQLQVAGLKRAADAEQEKEPLSKRAKP
jgi:hypothetical protein